MQNNEMLKYLSLKRKKDKNYVCNIRNVPSKLYQIDNSKTRDQTEKIKIKRLFWIFAVCKLNYFQFWRLLLTYIFIIT